MAAVESIGPKRQRPQKKTDLTELSRGGDRKRSATDAPTKRGYIRHPCHKSFNTRSKHQRRLTQLRPQSHGQHVATPIQLCDPRELEERQRRQTGQRAPFRRCRMSSRLRPCRLQRRCRLQSLWGMGTGGVHRKGNVLKKSKQGLRYV